MPALSRIKSGTTMRAAMVRGLPPGVSHVRQRREPAGWSVDQGEQPFSDPPLFHPQDATGEVADGAAG